MRIPALMCIFFTYLSACGDPTACLKSSQALAVAEAAVSAAQDVLDHRPNDASAQKALNDARDLLSIATAVKATACAAPI